MFTTSVTKEEFNAMVDTIERQINVIKSQASDIETLQEWLRIQHDRIDQLDNQYDFLFKQTQRSYRYIFWCALAIIFFNTALLIMLVVIIMR